MENLTNFQRAMLQTKGWRQRAQVKGQEYLGSKGLKGKAKCFSGKYDASSRNLITRLSQAKVVFSVELGPKGGWYSAILNVKD